MLDIEHGVKKKLNEHEVMLLKKLPVQDLTEIEAKMIGQVEISDKINKLEVESIRKLAVIEKDI
jgi:hypothetical protein